MKTSEFRKVIVKSEASNWFEAAVVTLEYPHIDFLQTLEGFSSIHKFLSQQINGWEKFESIPDVLNNSKEHFIDMQRGLEAFFNSNQSNEESDLNWLWNNEKEHFENKGSYFTYDSAYTEFLLNLNKRLPKSIVGAYNYIVQDYNFFNDRDSFIGYILAYEFDLKDKSEITERRKRETISFSKIKNDFRAQLSESEIQLTKHLGNANQEFENYVQKIDYFKTEKEKLFDQWFEGTEELLGAKKKIADLEHTYEELLRLKKPAEFWKRRAVILKAEGWKSIYWLISLVLFACISLYLLLWLTPEGMELSFTNGNMQAIKWSIIYVTFVSFLAYGIRALQKVAFSSFHLARDAEEKEQLTYVYLSLIKDNAIEEKDKNIILQSLFSRADTGLLKDDSGPTMPNDMAGKFFGK